MIETQNDQNDAVPVCRGYVVIHPDPNSITWHRDLWLVLYRHCEAPREIRHKAFETQEEAYAFSTVSLESCTNKLLVVAEVFMLLNAHTARMHNKRVMHTAVLQTEVVGRDGSEFLEKEFFGDYRRP